jgi:hypothetical protein
MHISSISNAAFASVANADSVHPATVEASSVSDPRPADRYDFSNMTVRQFFDAVSELQSTGQISGDEALDLICTLGIWNDGSLSHDEYLDLRMDNSYDIIQQQIACADAQGRIAERDISIRGLALLKRLNGTLRRVDVEA